MASHTPLAAMPNPAFCGPLVQAAGLLTVGALFRGQVDRSRDDVALQQGARHLTYGELNERVNRLAGVIAAHGVVRGDRVAIFSENRIEYAELQLAAAKLGVIVACQNWRLAPEELVHCLALVEPKMTFVSERHAGMLASLDCDFGTTIVFGGAYE